MIKNTLHKSFCGSNSKLSDWYCKKLQTLQFPIYSSYDIRDSGFKISNVDANIYPAGFNNICPTDQDFAGELFERYLTNKYGAGIERILLITEEHTGNPYYWDNVGTIQKLLQAAGKKVMLAFPKVLPEDLKLQSASGPIMQVTSGFATSTSVREFKPDLIMSNNDFSDPCIDWWESWKGANIPINPPRELGWYQRKKSRYFKFYNQLVEEFSQLISEDPFILNVRTEMFADFDMANDASMHALAEKTDQLLETLRADYAKRKIDTEPFAFIKNNAGTYGLGVIRVGSGKDVLEWNYKSRKKMKAAKGGRDINDVIIQEGIPSRVQTEGATAEPVVYMIGSELGGGFLRTHAEKSATDSLNSPGAVYKKLCVSDLNISQEGHPLENVYGWSARLGLMAIAMEAEEMKVQFAGWKAGAGKG